MVRYGIFQKRTLQWSTFLTRSKWMLLFMLLLIAMLGFIFIYRTPTVPDIETIRSRQMSLMDVFNFEVLYLQNNRGKNTWISIGVPHGSIYSAYLDVRPEIIISNDLRNKENELIWGEIRIIAILLLDQDQDSVSCLLKFDKPNSNVTTIRQTVAKLKVIEENWDLQFSAYFVLCDLRLPNEITDEKIYEMRFLPTSVSLGIIDDVKVNETATEGWKKIPYVDISYPKGEITVDYQADKFLAVCVPVLPNGYDQPLRLIEFIEFHASIGAEKFTFYVSSVSRDVDRVLNYYAAQDLVSVMDWQLPEFTTNTAYEKILHENGTLAALNDCLYRNSFHDSYAYVAGIAVNRFLVPRRHDNLRSLMYDIDPQQSDDIDNRYASFLFMNAYFYTMYEDEPKESTSGPYLYTFAKTMRVEEPSPERIESTYIVRGRDIVELGTHHVWELQPYFEEVTVDPLNALSHNYCECEAEELGCYLKKTVVDKSAHRFTKDLEVQVIKSCQSIFGNQGCPPWK